MDTNRVISIVLSDLSLENLKLQDKLEYQINADTQIDDKVKGVKGVLHQLVINELMITKFKSLVTPPNETQKPQQDGQIQ